MTSFSIIHWKKCCSSQAPAYTFFLFIYLFIESPINLQHKWIQFSHTTGSHVKPTAAWPLLQIQSLNTSSITLKTRNKRKSSRLVHYNGIVWKLQIFGWVGRKVGIGGRNKNNCPPHRSHDLYPGPSGVWEKHFSPVSFHSASEKLLFNT